MNTQNQSLIHRFDTPSNGFSLPVFIILAIVIVGIGTGAGYLLSKTNKTQTTSSSGASVNTAKQEGISDKKTFKDSAEGVLKEGGIDGEGNFHLERPGGVSQNVYLTSSTVDLSKYIGKKVKVHGETFNASKAGWLMDVGLVEVE